MSSWLKLKRLVHATKAWKAFTNKIPLKLHKFSSRSKAIAKPYKTRTHKKSPKKLSWPILSLSIQPNKFKNKRNKKPSLIQPKISHKKQLGNPVFVDKLFIEPPTAFSEADHEAQKPCSSSKNGTSDDQTISTDYRDDMNDHVSADDMWESMIVASPQMQGINERAEEFIARFRADMRRQEILVPRRL